MWIDTHCHLDADEFDALGRDTVRDEARRQGVVACVYPAVCRANWSAVRELAHRYGDFYALGIHPLFVPQAEEGDLEVLAQVLTEHMHDPRLVAVGEIGLDHFVPALREPAMLEKQGHFYRAQLELAQRFDLPVIAHVRRSADALLQPLRSMARQGRPIRGGIAHAFNGSVQQAQAFIGLGFKLGIGGAVTFDAALHLRRLAQDLPSDAIVMETDAPDIPPQWLYVTQAQRAQGAPKRVNQPAELPRIAAHVATLRGLSPSAWAQRSTQSALDALPRLRFMADNGTP